MIFNDDDDDDDHDNDDDDNDDYDNVHNYTLMSSVAACDHQVKMMPLGIDNLVLIDDEVNICHRYKIGAQSLLDTKTFAN